VTRLGSDNDNYRIAVPDRPGEHVTLSYAAVSDIGRRRHANEDSVIVRPPVFAVADGMGGHANGDLASSAVVARLAELAGREGVGSELIGASLTQAALDIDGLAEDVPLGVGTTVTGAVLDVRGPSFAVFNVGDSRVYRITDGYLEQLSVDHASGRSTLTQALGDTPGGLDPHVGDAPAQGRYLLCTDGVHGVLDERVLRRSCRLDDAAKLVEALRDEVYAEGAPDNLSLLVVDVAT
jgi:serine/threonine protein phosphatase PrpC